MVAGVLVAELGQRHHHVDGGVLQLLDFRQTLPDLFLQAGVMAAQVGPARP